MQRILSLKLRNFALPAGGARFARLLKSVWRKIPLLDRRAICRLWRKLPEYAGERGIVELLDYVDERWLAVCEGRRVLKFYWP